MKKFNSKKLIMFFLGISLAMGFYYIMPSNVMGYGAPYDAVGINLDGSMVAPGGAGYPPLYSTNGYQWDYSPSYGYGYPLSYYNSYDGFGYGYPTGYYGDYGGLLGGYGLYGNGLYGGLYSAYPYQSYNQGVKAFLGSNYYNSSDYYFSTAMDLYPAEYVQIMANPYVDKWTAITQLAATGTNQSTPGGYAYPFSNLNTAGGYAYPFNPIMTFPSYPGATGIGFNAGFSGSYAPYSPFSFSSFSSIAPYNNFQSPFSANPYSYFSTATPASYPFSPISEPSVSYDYAKPAIYLYPQEDTHVSVELDIDGKITKTIPLYNDGWNVLASNDGTITDESQGVQYDYLFWEAEANLSELEPSAEGWVVTREYTKEWFDENLPLFGLNEKEKEQFIEYWVDRLNESNYYEIRLLSIPFLEEHARLTITPTPDTLIRVIFLFTPSDDYAILEAPVIETPPREGFVVLEWGGILMQ